ncbi:alpha/beta hydrolase family protein [Fulvivirga imtechensis]|nr:dienelactone hydrolase [Fulvivirga imtechensis]
MFRILFIASVVYIALPQVFAQSDPAAPLNIGQATLTLIDSARKRPVKTEIWYPTEASLDDETREYGPFFRTPTIRNADPVDGKHPLIMMSHGTGGGRLTMEWLAAGLVKEGFIVAAVDHWGNTFDNIVPENFLKHWERPKDISFALTALLDHETFGALVDTAKIGAIGFSLGGYTVVALAGGDLDFNALFQFVKTPEGHKEASIPELPELTTLLQDENFISNLMEGYQPVALSDSRIDAVMALSPALGQGFSDESQMENITVPVFIIGARADNIAPVKTNARHYHELIDHSRFFLFEGAVGHYVFLNEAKEAIKSEAPIYFRDHESVSRKEIHNETIELATGFFHDVFHKK